MCGVAASAMLGRMFVQLAARYGGIGASGGGLIDGLGDRPPLNQYDRRNYRSDQSWLTWQDADCSAAALDWLLGAYGRTVSSLDDATTLVGAGTGISTSLGLLDERGPALAQAVGKEGPFTPGDPIRNHSARSPRSRRGSTRGPRSWTGGAGLGRGPGSARGR